MENKPAASVEVKAFIDILEIEGGKIIGIDLRLFEDSLFIVCECRNADHSRFITYLRGGDKKDVHIRCQSCGATLPFAEYKAKEKALIDKIKR